MPVSDSVKTVTCDSVYITHVVLPKIAVPCECHKRYHMSDATVPNQ